MEVRGPNSTHGSNVDRARDARRAKSAGADSSSSTGSSSAADQLDTSNADLVDRSVQETKSDLIRRLEDVRGRRDELLALAHDPEALRRAAEAFLDSD